jgi:hypothetical protein
MGSVMGATAAVPVQAKVVSASETTKVVARASALRIGTILSEGAWTGLDARCGGGGASRKRRST